MKLPHLLSGQLIKTVDSRIPSIHIDIAVAHEQQICNGWDKGEI